MSEKTKSLLQKLKENKELLEKISAMETPEVILAYLNEQGYDITMDEMLEAEKELSKEKAEASDDTVLSVSELVEVAGGKTNEIAQDGHEMNCAISYHHEAWLREHNVYCKYQYYCCDNFIGGKTHIYD